MIIIPKFDRSDKGLFVFVIISIAITSLAWIGDIASFIHVGNGFIIDGILLVIAISSTIITVYYTRRIRKKEPVEEIDEDLKELQELEEAEAKMVEETEYDKILSCTSCGALMTIVEENCPSCGSAKPVCIVCLSNLEGKDEIVKLTCCSSYAHKEHIENWISVKGYCPKCNKPIQEDQEYITSV